MLQRKPSNVSEKPKNKPKRSASFGRFDISRHHAARDKPEENGANSSADGEVNEGDQNKAGGLGKRVKAISMTMRKRMGRKYAKALSEEMGEDVDKDLEHERETDTGSGLVKACRRSSNSLESLYSLNSGQSSSSGVTSGSDGSSNRDSLRLDEDLPYTGQFCGKAKVHTDFVPSPYDTESLKLKVGDVIDIISKPPMGIWTGMLNNRVGNFKFIYVDVLPEEVVPPQQLRTHRRSKRPRPKTLQELLERLNLEDLASSLMLNGYETVDDLKELKEQHLIELNVTDPEQRHRLLAASEALQENDSEYPADAEEEPRSPSADAKADLIDCPRDSGCYIASDCSDNSKEDSDNTQPPCTTLTQTRAPVHNSHPNQCPAAQLSPKPVPRCTTLAQTSAPLHNSHPNQCPAAQLSPKPEETGSSGGNPAKHGGNMQTPHRKDPGRLAHCATVPPPPMTNMYMEIQEETGSERRTQYPSGAGLGRSER
ncbi:SAM domain-containing protein SAMSN-1b [Chanos chanos]|uniref:SAM domain-containing protein SAMSN-1b n=1 Tax=Chanos chanos TaxID=29144 RepID=A0A6J2WVD0_CHACN|nr:SAM domain-containing protein SAMSN-1-like [Chanos chanos]